MSRSPCHSLCLFSWPWCFSGGCRRHPANKNPWVHRDQSQKRIEWRFVSDCPGWRRCAWCPCSCRVRGSSCGYLIVSGGFRCRRIPVVVLGYRRLWLGTCHSVTTPLASPQAGIYSSHRTTSPSHGTQNKTWGSSHSPPAPPTFASNMP